MQFDKNESKYWKLGIFYFNSEDKRIFIPKRITAFGLTLNFGNPFSIIFILLLAVLIMFASFKL